MARVYLVRHGRAAAGWDTDPDPGLDDLGRHQATKMADQLGPLGPFALVSSPLKRCQETASFLGNRWARTATIEPAVAEIPSPEGIPMGQRIEWLRTAMAGMWTDLGARYTTQLLGRGVTWRLAVNNLTDKRYWSTIAPSNITGANTGNMVAHLGSPRTVAGSMTIDF